MGTPSSIAVVYANNEVRQINCHYDGYLSHVGQYLLNHYNSLDLAVTLISHGNLSFLEEHSEPTELSHSFETPELGVCVYYGRDRGEEDYSTLSFNTVEEYLTGGYCEVFNYLFKDGQWYVVDMEKLKAIPLTQELIDQAKENDEEIDFSLYTENVVDLSGNMK